MLKLIKDIPFYREALSKHTQLMNMYFNHNSIEMAKQQFAIVKPIFKRLTDEGEEMHYYTQQDFERDSKRFDN